MIIVEKEQMKQIIIKSFQLLLNQKDNEKETFITNFLGIIATMLTLEEAKTKEFIQQIGNLLTSVYCNPDLDIDSITSELIQVNNLINEKLEQSKLKKDEQLSSKDLLNKEKTEDFVDMNNHIEDSKEDNEMVSEKENIIAENSNQLESAIVTEKNGIQYQEHDWSAYVYGKNCLMSYFTSKDTAVFFNVDPSHITKRIHFTKEGTCFLQFRPNQLYRSINKKSRKGEKAHYLSLQLSSEEFDHLFVDETTKFNLEDGSDLMEAIIDADRRIGNCKQMKKIMLPYSEKEIVPDRDDVLFAKILFDFYRHKVYEINSTNSYGNFNIINILSNQESIHVSEMLYLARIFKQCNLSFTIDATEETGFRNPNFISSIYSQVDCSKNWSDPRGYESMSQCLDEIYINSKKPSTKRGLILDLAHGFSSKENIEEFYFYILNASAVKSWQKELDICNQTIERIRNSVRKDGLPLTEEDKKTKLLWEKQCYDSYNLPRECLKKFLPMRDETLAQLNELYELKYGKPIEEVGVMHDKKR